VITTFTAIGYDKEMLIIGNWNEVKVKICMTFENDSAQGMKEWMNTGYKYTFPV